MRKLICRVGLLCVVLLGMMGKSFAQSFSVQRIGEGKQAIILIPGFACSGDVWNQTVDSLRSNYTCYILTMPGFAGTASEANPSFDNWTKQIADFKRIKTYLDEKYGYELVKLDIQESYLNMAKIIKDNYYIIDNLNQAMTKVGIKAQATPIRGGTDGARLTFMGLPCPNIGTGGANFHGPFEFVSLTMMKQAVEVLKELIKE